MKSEAAAYLEKARQFLVKARGMLTQGWPDEAGRAAYLAGFHAAQALIFERNGKTPKTHSGVQTEFARQISRPVQVVNEIINGRKSITADTAVAFEKALGINAELWLKLEASFQISKARAALKKAPRQRAKVAT